MSGLMSLTLADDRLQASQPYCLNLFFTVTAGAVTNVLTKNLPPIIFGVAATAFTQAAVNRLLSPDAAGDDYSATSTSEINTAVAFGATAMGVDAFGFVISMQQQVDNVIGVRATLLEDAEDIKFAGKVTSLPDTLTAGLLVTPAGNLAGRVIPTGLDASTGVLQLEIYFFSK